MEVQGTLRWAPLVVLKPSLPYNNTSRYVTLWYHTVINCLDDIRLIRLAPHHALHTGITESAINQRQRRLQRIRERERELIVSIRVSLTTGRAAHQRERSAGNNRKSGISMWEISREQREEKHINMRDQRKQGTMGRVAHQHERSAGNNGKSGRYINVRDQSAGLFMSELCMYVHGCWSICGVCWTDGY